MSIKKDKQLPDPTKGNKIMNYIYALPGGALITAGVLTLIHYGSIIAVSVM